MIELIALPIAGLADRVRGGYPDGRDGGWKRPKWGDSAALIIIGPLMVLQVTTNPIALGVSLLFGHWMWLLSNSWRGNWVAVFETKTKEWDSGYLQEAIGWGAWASIPFMCLIPVDSSFIWSMPIFAIASPLVMFISTKIPNMPKFLELRNAWPWSEFIELPIIGLILNLITRI